MSDDFGLINPVNVPFLVRVSREEQLREELPRKSGEQKTGKAKKKSADNEPDASQTDDPSTTSRLIDLRI